MTVAIKICCIASEQELELAAAAGASAVGLVSAMPSGPGPIPEERIARLAAAAPRGLRTFLLTCQEVEAIVDQQRRCRATTLQLCDALPAGGYARLRDALPGVELVQVIHVRGRGSLDEALAVAEHVDGLLLDSGNPALVVKELGGTGRVHDWEVSREICQAVSIPVFLAGGLRADNVRAAIDLGRPYGVDVCSGVRTFFCRGRTSGKLDPAKLEEFVRAARGPVQ